MPIEFRCTTCNRLLRTADDTAGKQARCPECGTIMMVPMPGVAPPPGPVPPPPRPVPPPSHRGFDTTIPGGAAPTNPAAGGSGSQSPFGSSGDFGAMPPPPYGSDNPYQAPSTFSPGIRPHIASADLRAYAAQRVGAPAIALMIVGALGFVSQLFLGGILAFHFAGGLEVPDDVWGEMVSGGAILGLAMLSLFLSLLVILGALKMRKLESYGFAIAASVIVMLPFNCACAHPCCLPVWLIGIAFGIWSVVVLSDAQVKSAFRS